MKLKNRKVMLSNLSLLALSLIFKYLTTGVIFWDSKFNLPFFLMLALSIVALVVAAIRMATGKLDIDNISGNSYEPLSKKVKKVGPLKFAVILSLVMGASLAFFGFYITQALIFFIVMVQIAWACITLLFSMTSESNLGRRFWKYTLYSFMFPVLMFNGLDLVRFALENLPK